MTDTPNTTQGKGAVDWTRPIEAVHEDGRVVPMHFGGTTWDRRAGRVWLTTDSPAGNSNENWRENGEDFCRNSGWGIRNVSEHPTPTQYAPELVERMVAFIRRLDKWDGSFALGEDRTEARSIVSDLPQEAVPEPSVDLREARDLGVALCSVLKLDGMAQRFRDGKYDGEAEELHKIILNLGMPK